MDESRAWQENRPVKVEFLIRKYLVKKALNNSRRFNYFHPSAWGQCLRKVAYQYYNEQEPFVLKTSEDVDDRMERIFDNGHSTHARWQNYLDQAGVLRGYWRCPNPLCHKLYGQEELIGVKNPSAVDGWQCSCGSKGRLAYEEIKLKTNPSYNFEGHCDAVIDIRGTEFEQKNAYDVYVADLKTMKDDLYSELIEPKHEHVVQVNIYMWILNLQGAVVVYENKDNQALKEMFVPRDDDLIRQIQNQSLWMQELLKNKKLPYRPKDFTRSKFPCRFCEFVNYCYR